MNLNTNNVFSFFCFAGLTMLLFCTARDAALPAEGLPGSGSDYSSNNQDLARKILSNPNLPLVLEKAKSILKKGLTAGSGYGEVWIRDLNNGFFEWYTIDNQPSGSGTFRGSAGVLGKAVQMFQKWAKDQ
ncbi:MAG: hypothetical protein PVJ86_00930 [Phycisphaerales bacterium]|jgi:hypothetical protein